MFWDWDFCIYFSGYINVFDKSMGFDIDELYFCYL